MQRRWPVRRAARGAAYARLVAFLLGFGALLIFVCYDYLFPAMEAWARGTPLQRKLLSAHALLLMALVLFILLVGLILTFRVGRFFLPRRRPPLKPTVYPDAWAESARRIQVPEDEPE